MINRGKPPLRDQGQPWALASRQGDAFNSVDNFHPGGEFGVEGEIAAEADCGAFACVQRGLNEDFATPTTFGAEQGRKRRECCGAGGAANGF